MSTNRLYLYGHFLVSLQGPSILSRLVKNRWYFCALLNPSHLQFLQMNLPLHSYKIEYLTLVVSNAKFNEYQSNYTYCRLTENGELCRTSVGGAAVGD